MAFLKVRCRHRCVGGWEVNCLIFLNFVKEDRVKTKLNQCKTKRNKKTFGGTTEQRLNQVPDFLTKLVLMFACRLISLCYFGNTSPGVCLSAKISVLQPFRWYGEHSYKTFHIIRRLYSFVWYCTQTLTEALKLAIREINVATQDGTRQF